MIERIRLTNFKNHADTQIELGKLTALIGPNSSGKTNVLQALAKASQLVSNLHMEGRDSSFVRDKNIDSLIRRGQQTSEICIAGRTRIRIDVAQVESLSFHVKVSSEQRGHTVDLQWDGKSEQTLVARDMTLGALSERLKQESGNAFYLKAIGKNLSESSYSEEISPQVKPDGTGLASAVAYFKTYEEKRFPGLLKALRSVVPSVENIRVRPAPVRIKERQVIKVDDQVVQHDKEREVMGHELVFDMTGAQELPASSVSEGTLLALALLTLLWSPDCPNLVLLDDIEQGLHPKAQRELIAQLRKILEQRPELQIVLTSHSPYIVDELKADEVWLLATDEEGVAQARRLSDHPDAERALEVLTTGEFWSAEGEDWVVADGK